jgi:plastocyanin
MKTLTTAALAVIMMGGYWAAGRFALNAQSNTSNDNNIAMLDACDPRDTSWNATGGCALRPQQGDVSLSEFQLLLTSPLAAATVGHPAWRNEPSYVNTDVGHSIRVTNRGGRTHTFTEVAEFGGGRVGLLNVGLQQAPECVSGAAVDVQPGATQTLNLSTGLHKFQCCIHPWMRAAVRVD